MRVAAVDLGTNSTRLLVAEVEDGRVEELDRETVITRLGEVEWSYGFDTRLLSGEDEAAMTVRGVSAGRELEPGTLVLDVGDEETRRVRPEVDRSDARHFPG